VVAISMAYSPVFIKLCQTKTASYEAV